MKPHGQLDQGGDDAKGTNLMEGRARGIRNPRVRYGDGLVLGGLAAVYLVLHGAMALAIPAFEPAMHNDDWVNALVVRRMCEDGQFQLHWLTGALAVPQILAGWAWCQAVGGFSFTALRTLMVLHGVLPVWLLWWLLRRLKFDRVSAALAALLFGVNPITVSLTWSFQTDMVYLSFVLAALLATLWADRSGGEEATDETRKEHGDTEESVGAGARSVVGSVFLPSSIRGKTNVSGSEACLVLAAALLLLLAFSTRQSAIFVTVGVAAYWGLRRRWLWFACTLAMVPVMMSVENWLVGQSQLIYLPWVKDQLMRSLGDWSLGRIVFCTYETLHVVVFLGLLLLPLLVVWAPEMMHARHVAASVPDAETRLGEPGLRGAEPTPDCRRFSPGRCVWLLAALSLAGGVLLIGIPSGRTALPGNYIYVGERCGIGPATLDVSADNPAGVARGGEHPVLMTMIGVAALAGGGLMLVALGDSAVRCADAVRRWRGNPRLLVEITFWASLAGTLAASVLIGRTPFDRYVLLLVPLAMPLCLRPGLPVRRLLAVCVPVAVLLAVISYAGVVDYWRWNHARWRALSWLESQDIAPERIDGGYEFNAIHDTLGLPPEMMTQQNHERQAAVLAARQGRKTYSLRYSVGPQDPFVAQFGYETPLAVETQYIYVREHSPVP